jgi:hypothetical protein
MREFCELYILYNFRRLVKKIDKLLYKFLDLF